MVASKLVAAVLAIVELRVEGFAQLGLSGGAIPLVGGIEGPRAFLCSGGGIALSLELPDLLKVGVRHDAGARSALRSSHSEEEVLWTLT